MKNPLKIFLKERPQLGQSDELYIDWPQPIFPVFSRCGVPIWEPQLARKTMVLGITQ
jgi:hypothetical protein